MGDDHHAKPSDSAIIGMVVGDRVAQRALLGDDPLFPRPRRLPEVGVVNAEKPAEPRQSDPSLRGPLPAPGGGVGRTMKIHVFTLILSGVAEITPDLADALYTAVPGDVEFNLRDGVAFLEFERMAATLREAVTAAIREVEGVGVGVRVVHVESEAANVIAKINAERLT
jgi:hypothetical protein